MRTYFAAMVVVAIGAASNMMANSIVAVGPQNYTYDLSLPSITVNGFTATEDDTTHFDVQFSWLGPEMYNAGPDTSCPLGCPVDGTTPGSPAAGFTYSSIAFTASVSGACATAPPNNGCGEVLVDYADTFGDSITYTLIGLDSFWASSGVHSFASGDGLGPGATWVYQASATQLPGDPGCTSCSVTTSTSPVAPEPGTWLLLAGGLGAAAFVHNRRVKRLAA